MTAPQASPERRAAVVAGIRALADLLETDTALPVPQSVHAQYSIPGGLDDAGRQMIRNIAAHLGIDPAAKQWQPNSLIDEPDRAAVHMEVAGGYTPQDGSYSVRYVVHGMVESAESVGGAE